MNESADTFAAELARFDLDGHEALAQNCTEDRFRRAMARPGTGLEDFCALLSPWGRRNLEWMAREAGQVTRRRFGATIHLYAPVYLSSHCTSRCVYCGFRAGRAFERRRLTLGQMEEEVSIIRSRGIQHVLLVAGNDPQITAGDWMERAVEGCHRMVSSVSLEIEPLEEARYRSLASRGMDGLVVYQETYDPTVYERLHPSGSKRDFAERLEKPARGARVPLRRVGLGVLLGLVPWRRDLICLALHLRHLMQRHWRVQFTVGLPRFRPAGVDFRVPAPVDDADFTQIICALRLQFPDMPVYLSTRESPRLRDGLVHCGVSHLSAGSRTSPGGYSADGPESHAGQFDIEDSRSPDEIAGMLRRAGLDPVWKDWEAVLNDTDPGQRQAG